MNRFASSCLRKILLSHVTSIVYFGTQYLVQICYPQFSFELVLVCKKKTHFLLHSPREQEKSLSLTTVMIKPEMEES